MTTPIAFSLEDAIAISSPEIIEAFVAQFNQSPELRQALTRNFALWSVSERHDEALASIARRASVRLVAAYAGLDDDEAVRRADDSCVVSFAGLKIAAKAAAAFAPTVAGLILLFVDGVKVFVDIDGDDEEFGLTIEGEEALFRFVERFMPPGTTFGVHWQSVESKEDVIIDTSFAPGALVSACPNYRKRMAATSSLIDGRWKLHVGSIDEYGAFVQSSVSGDVWIVAKRAYETANIVARI